MRGARRSLACARVRGTRRAVAGAGLVVADHACSVCDHIVETEGPRAVTCDPEKLAQYLPEHTCVLIVCHFDDGSAYQTGGCTP